MKFKYFQIKNLYKQIITTIIISLLMNASAIFGQNNYQIKSKLISIVYDKFSLLKIQYLSGNKINIIAFDSVVQPGIVIDGKIILKFKVKSITQKNINSEFGKALASTITGFFDDGIMKIERKIYLLLPEKFPNAIITKATYINLGKESIHIDSVFSQRILLKSKNQKDRTQLVDFASFQGGINEWGKNYSLIWLTPGFYQSNFQGIHKTKEAKGNDSAEFIGGGMPFVDVWNKDMGVALMHIEKFPQWLSLPVTLHRHATAEISIIEKPEAKFGMQEWLATNDSFTTVQTAIVLHHLDYFDALKTYGDLLRCKGIDILKTSPQNAYEPYWKSWGLGMNFTLEKIYNTLPELKKIGIRTANLDDGWFDFYGEWNVNKSVGKFPNGEKDMIAFVKKIHAEGFKTNLWWYPLGVSPNSTLAKDRSDLLVQNEDGSFPTDNRNVYQFCPAYEPSLKYIQALVEKFTLNWGYDGLYTDARGLAAVPPCFNKAHHHQSPLESFQQVPNVYKLIFETLQKNNKNALHEVCICATPHSPYNMPYYQIASASDPVDLFQVRRRVKVEKAIHGATFCVGDCYQVPKNEWDGYSVKESFETSLGIGAQLTTFYKNLDSTQFRTWKNGFTKYNELKLSSAEYLNLYDIVFDKPEIHVVEKDDDMYYGIYADSVSSKKNISLRGLKKGINYSVYDYLHNKNLGTVNGNNPVINVDFGEYLLIRLKPIKK